MTAAISRTDRDPSWSSSSRPRASRDVVAAMVPVDRSHVVVKHPARRRYFRLSAPAVAALDAMDGTKSIAQLSDSLGVTTARMQELVGHLDELGLLDDARDAGRRSDDGIGVADAGLPRWLRRLLFVSLDVGAPDRAVDHLYRVLRLGTLLQRGGMALATIGVLLASAALAMRSQHVVDGVSRGFEAQWSWLVAVVWLSTRPVHELGHAVACKHFNRHSRALGVGLYFFIPVLYVDASDVWLLPDKRSRIWVHMAGLVAEASLLCLALIGLLISPTEPVAVVSGSLLLVVALSAAMNLNPMLKLDGYFVVSDLVGVRNLREKAFGTLFSQVRGTLHQMGIPVERGAYSVGAEAKTLGLTIYAAVALGYSGAMLVAAASRLSSWLDAWGAARPLTYLPYGIGSALFALFTYFIWSRSTTSASRRF